MLQPETSGASGPGPAFRQFASIGDEIAYSTKCRKVWRERGDSPSNIAVICMKPDHGKRIAHQLQALGVSMCSWPPEAASGPTIPRNPRTRSSWTYVDLCGKGSDIRHDSAQATPSPS